MRRKLVAANWKMNGSKESIHLLLEKIFATLPSPLLDRVIFFPPAIYLDYVCAEISGQCARLGAQNADYHDKGAFTGEISMSMLSDIGCKFVLTGHSERRQHYHENNEIVAQKFHQAQYHGLIPMLCIGETAEERAAGKTFEVLKQQILAIIEKNARSFKQAMVAYEPVWAIGTGNVPTVEMVEETHRYIRSIIAGYHEEDAVHLPVFYGGSVNAKTAALFLSSDNVDGVLVGNASLDATEFVDIVKCTN